MKAILVIDLPDGYETDEVLLDYVLTTKGEYKVLRKGGNHEVRPMPEKKLLKRGWVKDTESWFYGTEFGWNECIEEILGETE